MRLHRLHLNNSAGKDIHHGGSRKEFVDLCLKSPQPFLAIGWSYLYEKYPIASFNDFLNAYYIEEGKKSTPHLFSKLAVDDLIWTRDLNGVYYLCRVIGEPKCYSDLNNRLRLDIGATIDVELHKVGLSVPGAVVSRFYSTNGRKPTLQAIIQTPMVEYAKHQYNKLIGSSYYQLDEIQYNIFDMLDAWDLEELVIDYLQIKYDYYLSKNSMTKQDGTIKIECELYPRKDPLQRPAVVQVKRMRNKEQPCDFYDDYYFKENKDVFLFYADEDYDGYKKEIRTISRKELEEFMKFNKNILPQSIKFWCKFCGL